MTAREAVETVVREAAEAGVELGPAGRDEAFREAQIAEMEARPVVIAAFLQEARAIIAAGGLAQRMEASS